MSILQFMLLMVKLTLDSMQQLKLFVPYKVFNLFKHNLALTIQSHAIKY